MSAITPSQILHGHTDEDTAFVVDDYPYGRLRTQIRYWVESVERKGDRMVSQTLNPKTDCWNKPKKSTYSPVIALFLEEQDDGRMFVKRTGLGIWHTDEDARNFIDLVGRDNLNPVQRKELAKVLGMNKVMQHVTFVVHEGEYTEEDKQQGLENQRLVNRAIAVESFRAHQELQS